MHRGSCLCGSIEYEIAAEVGVGYYCHCKRCRKASGSAFAANAVIPAETFRLLRGEDSLRTYFNEETGLKRKFCGNCGSPILSERPATGLTAIRLGTIDTALATGPIAHIFVGSKAPWSEIADNLPCYSERPVS